MLNAIAVPFGWLLMVLYEFTKSYGLSVIIFALIVKLILLPFMMKSKKSMMRMSRLQPKLKELEVRHAANKAKYNEEVQKLYREEKIHPLSGCIWTLIPFPILIALYQAIRQPLTIMMGVASDLVNEGGAIYNKLIELGWTTTTGNSYIEISQAQFISNHFNEFSSLSDKLRQLNYSFLGIDLGALPDWKFFLTTDWSNPSIWGQQLALFMIPVIAGVLTYFSSKISAKTSGTEQPNNMKGMMIVMPLVSIYIGFIMPAALGLYWIASYVFSIIQDTWLNKRYKKIFDAEDAAKKEIEDAKAAEIEAKRIETERLRAENATALNRNTSKKKQQAQQRQEKEEIIAEKKRQERLKSGKEIPKKKDPRQYSRGRAYDPDRFANAGTEAAAEDAAEDEIRPDEEPDTALLNESGNESAAENAAKSAEDTDGNTETEAGEDLYESFKDEDDDSSGEK